MRVVYQDCGCVALPEEIVSMLGLVSGSVIDISYDFMLRVAVMARVDPLDAPAGETIPPSCRIRTTGA